MRVDAHHHVWDPAAREHDWLTGAGMEPLYRAFTVADLAPQAAAAGVTSTVLVQVLADVDESAEFLALADRSDLVSGVVGWVDLTRPDVAGTLARLRELPGGDRLVGVRHLVQGETDPEWLNRPDVRRGLAAVAAAGLCYDLLTLPHQLPAAIATAQALPELRFVLDHLSKPPIASGELKPWAGLLRDLAAEPNVTCKLSGMVTEADPANVSTAALRPYAEVVFEAFGPDRVMFGSDWPVCLLVASYAEVVALAEELVADLSPDERDAVFAGTAIHTYRLDT